ncbi:4-coumarate--CoA ligase-like 2 [Chenopodium quinoa]|uniref:4-coumarate--CoA ligase-like 2 n=1 Tax=Chenopodium quinoa TaxID=63459 RepID=UPI000B787704|nr:4-coumarate--CoA ligase-like 2 [Chenopodium quinoa]XP_021762411.1 4-coumarate--CoA ligase-like 2 [Chenopodium quinoa]
MLIAILCESELKLADDIIEQILYKIKLESAKSKFQKWHSSFQDESFISPATTPGYFNNHEATVSTLTSDGWLKTGDVCYFDEDGLWFSIDPLTEIC